MNAQIKKMRICATDRLRYSGLVQNITGSVKALRAQFIKDPSERLDRLADAYRMLLAAGDPGKVESLLRPYVESPEKASIWRDEHIGWKKFEKTSRSPAIGKGLILKEAISPKEKGVILVSFEYNLPPLLRAHGSAALLRDYTIVCAPSWSPTHFQAYWTMAHIPGGDVFFMISNQADIGWFQRLNSGTHVLPLFISSWVDPEPFKPLPRKDRPIDILMVANWAPFKRHWVLFKALQNMRRDLRVVLVGQPETGRTKEHILAEAKLFGVQDRIEIRERLPITEVNALQCSSKITLVLSKREGSCVVVAESMFADTPVGLVEGAHIGSAAFINDQTGMFLNESRMSSDLSRFLERAQDFRPRAWALQNISCFESAKRLNASLREHALKNGQQWTVDAAPFCCRPDPVYARLEDEQRLRAIYPQVRDRYGLVFPKWLAELPH